MINSLPANLNIRALTRSGGRNWLESTVTREALRAPPYAIAGKVRLRPNVDNQAGLPDAVIEEDSAPYKTFGDCAQTDFKVSFKVNLCQQSNQYDAIRTPKALA